MRFAENELDNVDELDFVPRERRGQISSVVIAFAAAFVVLSALVLLPEDMVRPTHAAIAAMAVIVGLAFYIIYRKQQNLDLVMHTEYQNMLFAQAAAQGSSFCLFVRRDGTIVYANDGLANLFPRLRFSESQALQSIFEHGNVQGNDRERIMSAIFAGKGDRLVFPLTAASGERKEYIMTLEPLKRPNGFMVIRGREYRNERAGVQLLPEVLRATSADRIDHLLSTTPIAHFITDAYGKIEYANPAMEQLLGFASGEVIALKLSLQQLLYQLNRHPLAEDYTPQNFSGHAEIKQKQGTLLAVALRLTTFRDEAGKLQSVSGTMVAGA